MNLVNRIYVCFAMRRMIIAAAISSRVCAEQQCTGRGVGYLPGETINQYRVLPFKHEVFTGINISFTISIIVFRDLVLRTFVDVRCGK
jgi:hypothetical protein